VFSLPGNNFALSPETVMQELGTERYRSVALIFADGNPKQCIARLQGADRHGQAQHFSEVWGSEPEALVMSMVSPMEQG